MMNKLASLLILSFLVSINIVAQNSEPLVECGTVLTPEQEEYLNKTRELRQNMMANKSAKATTYVPIQHHIVRKSDGSGGMAPIELVFIMQELNHYYAPVDIIFYECNAVNFIDDDTYYDFLSSQETTLGNAQDVTDVINIYYFNTVKSGSTPVCGYSRFPPSVDRVIMDDGCATNGSTIIHELGHYFTLYHTHGKTNTGTTNELVNGSNCTTEGDDLCDTPADPNLSGKVNTTCGYTGTGLDANNQAYTPQTNNIMSYSRKACRKLLTSDQLNRAQVGLQFDRNYLSCPSPSAPIADFILNTSSSCNGAVQFYDRSTSLPTTWTWTFGDGNSSSAQNPLHVYSANGTYNVSMTSSNSNGSNSVTKNAVVTIALSPDPQINAVDSICEGQSASLVATGGSAIYWYDTKNGGSPIATGNVFNTPNLFSSTTYYASSDYPNATLNLGPLDNSIGSTSSISTHKYLEFDAEKPFTLQSVKLYANGAGDRTIELRNYLDLVIQDTTVSLVNGVQSVTLNFKVPAENDLQLGTSVVSLVDLMANTSGASYPYSLNGVASITGSNGNSSTYYYFYDWKIQESNCSSARIPVEVGVKDCFSDIADLHHLSEIQLLPNPTTGKFTIINNNFDLLNVSIYSLVGTEVRREVLYMGKNQLDISNLPAGVYILSYTHNNSSLVTKLVKSKH